MTNHLCKGLVTIAFVLLFGSFHSQVFAAKIDLDNTSTTTSSQSPGLTTYLNQFSRFSLNGPIVNTGFAPPPLPQTGPTKVSIYSLSDYGLTSSNFAQVGGLLQVQFSINLSGQAGSASGEVTLFFVDPVTLQHITVGSKLVNTSTGTTAVFSLADFGALPANLNPDFYIGVRGTVGLNNTGMSASGSNLGILSTIPTPEPASMLLLFSGLAGSGAVLRLRRRSKSTSDANHQTTSCGVCHGFNEN